MFYKNRFVVVSIVVVFCLILVSCPLDNAVPIDYKLWGVNLDGYQDWMKPSREDVEAKGGVFSNHFGLYGYSDWIDWESSSGKAIRPYINNTPIGDDFIGKFRVLAIRQNFYVGFNDENFTTVAFYNYCGLEDEILIDDDGKKYRAKALTKIDDNFYLYEANFIEYLPKEIDYYYFEKKKDPENRATILIRKIEGNDNDFRYTIKVKNKDVFDGSLHRLSPYTVSLDSVSSWFPKEFREISGKTSNHTSSAYYGDASFEISDNDSFPSTPGKILNYSFELKNKSLPILSYLDGIENATLDNESQTFKFYLKGRKEYGTVDYVVCKVLNEVPIGQSDNLSPVFVNLARKGTLTFYKENPNGDDIIVKHFDENHTEFKVRGNL